MTKIQTITLKDVETYEENGEWKQRYKNEKRFPAAITNYSLALGEQLGMTSSSQMTDLADVQKVFEAAMNPERNREKALEGLNINQFLKVIYLSIMGMNPQLNLSYEEFTARYHETIPDTIETYTNLVLGTLGVDENAFAKELMKNVKKTGMTNKASDLPN